VRKQISSRSLSGDLPIWARAKWLGKRSPSFRKYGKTGNRVVLDPATDLYGNILFQSGRFQRVDNYRHLMLSSVSPEIVPDGHTSWLFIICPEASSSGIGRPRRGDARDSSLHSSSNTSTRCSGFYLP